MNNEKENGINTKKHIVCNICIYIYIYIYAYIQSNSLITLGKGLNVLCRYKRVLL
jgi:hypothetical protein